MSRTATLEINGKKYEFPLIQGTENEIAIDIKTLRGVTGGVTTLDPGYKNTGACESGITFLDGEKGILRYRGSPIYPRRYCVGLAVSLLRLSIFYLFPLWMEVGFSFY